MCEKCGKAMIIRWGRFGQFLACTGFPDCKNTKPIGEEAEQPALTDEKCDECGSEMVLKRGRFGQFMACSRYPDCKGSRPILKKVGVECPKDGGDIVEKRSKKGRTFYSCANYPNCDFTSWSRPLKQACPSCRGLTVTAARGTAKCTRLRLEGRHSGRHARARARTGESVRVTRQQSSPPNRDEVPQERTKPRGHHVHVSRRSFLAGAGAIVATGAAATVFGCDERESKTSVAGTTASPQNTPVPTPNPERGGTLRVYNFDAMPYDSIDPHQTAMGPIVNMHAAIYSRLLRYTDEFTGTDRAGPRGGDAGAAGRHDVRVQDPRRRPLSRHTSLPRHVPRHRGPPADGRRHQTEHRAPTRSGQSHARRACTAGGTSTSSTASRCRTQARSSFARANRSHRCCRSSPDGMRS